MEKKIYFCVGCRQFHFDNDYNEKEGDLSIGDIDKVKDSLARVQKQMLSEIEGKKNCIV